MNDSKIGVARVIKTSITLYGGRFVADGGAQTVRGEVKRAITTVGADNTVATGARPAGVLIEKVGDAFPAADHTRAKTMGIFGLYYLEAGTGGLDPEDPITYEASDGRAITGTVGTHFICGRYMGSTSVAAGKPALCFVNIEQLKS